MAGSNGYNNYLLSAAKPSLTVSGVSTSVYTETQHLHAVLYPRDYPTPRKFFHRRNWVNRFPYEVAIDPSEYFTNLLDNFPIWLERHDVCSTYPDPPSHAPSR